MGVTVPTGNIDPPAVESTLWVSSRIPQGLHLANLEKMIGAFAVQWEAGPYRNMQRTISRSGFAELWLNYRDRRTLLARTFIEQDLVERTESISRIDGYLMDWLILTKGQIADRGSNLYVSPSEEELLYFDQEVVTPLLELVKSGYANGSFSEIAEMDLSGIAASASQVGYQIVWYHHLPSKQDYLILSEGQDEEARNYRGTYIFRLGMAKPYMLHVPRPLYERSTFEFGVNLYEQLRASVILIAGAHKEANVDGSSDLVRPSNKKTFFNLVNQVVLREAKDDPMMVISCRAFGYRDDAPTAEADLILSRADGGITESSLSYLGMEVIHYLNQGLFEYVFVDGRWETAGYEAASTFQSKYLRQSVNKEFLAMWISPYTRRAYALQDEAGRLESHFVSLDIATSDVVLLDYLQDYRDAKKNEDVPSSLSSVVTRFLRTGDILALAQLREELPEEGLLRVIDKNSKQTFLIVFAEPGYKPWVINLAARLNQIESVYQASELNQETLDQYISSHFAWLAW